MRVMILMREKTGGSTNINISCQRVSIKFSSFLLLCVKLSERKIAATLILVVGALAVFLTLANDRNSSSDEVSSNRVFFFDGDPFALARLSFAFAVGWRATPDF